MLRLPKDRDKPQTLKPKHPFNPNWLGPYNIVCIFPHILGVKRIMFGMLAKLKNADIKWAQSSGLLGSGILKIYGVYRMRPLLGGSWFRV